MGSLRAPVMLMGGLLLATALGLGLWLAGGRGGGLPAPAPAPGDAAAGPPQGHVYTGVTEEPEHLNPFTIRGGVARRYVLGFTHDTLLDTDPVTGDLRPALATAWQTDADGLGITFELRTDATFADGSPVLPADVLFTWEVARGARGALGSMGDGLRLVREAELLPGEPPRLRVLLAERHFAAVRAVAESWIVVQKAHVLRRLAELAADAGAAAPQPDGPDFAVRLGQLRDCGPGSGPYQLGRLADGAPAWRPARDLLLVQHETSWRRRVRPGTWNLGGIRLLFLADRSAAFTALLERQIDWYAGPDAGRLLVTQPALAADYRRVDYDYLNLGFLGVEWNLQRPALRDPRVRRALGMLFDRQAIATELLGGAARPAAAFYKPGTKSHPDDLLPLPFDPAAARRLLREAGVAGADGAPLRLRVLLPAGADVYRRTMTLAVAAAEQAGIDLQTRELEWAALTRAQQEGDWDGCFLMVSHRTWVDPFDTFHSKGGANTGGLADPAVDRLLEQIRPELDDDRRAGLERALCHRLAELQPVAFLVHPLVSVLFNRHIRDAEPGVLGLYPERWWVPPDHQRK